MPQPAVLPATPTPNPATIDAADRLTFASITLCQEMMKEGIEHPLLQPISMAALLADLFRHLGQPVPSAITAVIG